MPIATTTVAALFSDHTIELYTTYIHTFELYRMDKERDTDEEIYRYSLVKMGTQIEFEIRMKLN